MNTTSYTSPSTYSTQDSTPTNLLSRPRHGRMIGGVCAGIARRYGWDPKWVRVAAVATLFLPGPFFVAYLLAWALMPEDQQ